MSDKQLAVGIDFGATTLKTCVVFQSHVIDRSAAIPTSEFVTHQDLIDVMVRSVLELRARHPGIVAVGAGVPGFVDFQKGWVYSLTNVSDWNAVPLGRILSERIGLPAIVDNRSNCMAIAEWKCGAARGLRDVFFIKLDTGVGGSVIANGSLVRGARHVAGEIGQTSMDWRGVPGKFGNPGAVEQFLGSAAIAADTRDAYARAGVEKTLAECSITELISSGMHGDPVALGRWDEIGRMLATVVMNACWILNPEAVVVGGGIRRAGDLLLTPLRMHLFSQLSEPFKDRLMVLPSAFGSESGAIGAAALALETRSIMV